MKHDVVIIGAGIVGCMTARFLSRYDLDILLIDRADDVGSGASAANSAILHSGHDPEPGTLKARMNAGGSRMWSSLADELGIPVKHTGSYVVAVDNDGLPALDTLLRRAEANGIPGARIVSGAELREKEPLVNPDVTGALWTPTAAVVDPFAAVLAAAENAVANGVVFQSETTFLDFIIDNGAIKGIRTDRGDIECGWVINAAGAYSAEVMHRAGVRPDYHIVPRRGEYLIFDRQKVRLENVLFPVPTDKGKGTIVSTTVHGNIMIGPNAMEIDDSGDVSTTTAGMDEVIASAKSLVPSLDIRYVIAEFAGIRASGYPDRDFIIEASVKPRGLLNIAGIESPGFVSAPAIAAHAVELLRGNGFALRERGGWNPIREPRPVFREMSHAERAEITKADPAYGRIICRCEDVTEAEVLSAIRSIVPARSYDAIKRRTWLGTGRCQGGFDYPRVIELLAEELGIPVTEVTKSGGKSRFIYRATKDINNA
ncbi:MAG: NAD(P)/FAD-dependent oxidoreductase [Brevinematales bacterium]|nr:NAD(P)/FAD-dependent oxidoreductase [Brevinematales bacterium]